MIRKLKKYLWELIALAIIAVFILFELRFTIVLHEVTIETVLGFLFLVLSLKLIKNIKAYQKIKWKRGY